jgi:hypothetical protein
VELRGSVSDDHPEHDTVTFTGMASGSVMPDMNGNFDFFTTGFGLGTVTAVAMKYPGNQSAPVNAMISSGAPTITSFQVIHSGPGTWTFQGSVSDEAPMGIEVQFGGNCWVAGLTATVDQRSGVSVLDDRIFFFFF